MAHLVLWCSVIVYESMIYLHMQNIRTWRFSIALFDYQRAIPKKIQKRCSLPLFLDWIYFSSFFGVYLAIDYENCYVSTRKLGSSPIKTGFHREIREEIGCCMTLPPKKEDLGSLNKHHDCTVCTPFLPAHFRPPQSCLAKVSCSARWRACAWTSDGHPGEQR